MSINIEKALYDKAVDFIKKRYPNGWGGAAVIHTEDDRYLISVAPEVLNASTELCIETGAICEAHKFNVRVTHCICVMRENENENFKSLTPCGVCQERLRYWGEDVKVGVTTNDNQLKFVQLKDLMPYYWGNAYKVDNE